MGDWASENWEAIMAMNPLPPKSQPCAVPGCPREKRAKGLCLTHYQLARTKFDPEFRERVRATQRKAYRKRQDRAANQPMVAALGEPDPAASKGQPHWTQPEFWQVEGQPTTPEEVTGGQGAGLPEARGLVGGTDSPQPAAGPPEGSENMRREGQ